MHTNDSEWNSSNKLVGTWWHPEYLLGHLILEIISQYPLRLLQTRRAGHKPERTYPTIRERVFLPTYKSSCSNVRLTVYVYIGQWLLQRLWTFETNINTLLHTHTRASGTFYRYTVKLIHGISCFIWYKCMFELGPMSAPRGKTCVRCSSCFSLRKRRRLLAKCIPRQSVSLSCYITYPSPFWQRSTDVLHLFLLMQENWWRALHRAKPVCVYSAGAIIVRGPSCCCAEPADLASLNSANVIKARTHRHTHTLNIWQANYSLLNGVNHTWKRNDQWRLSSP